MAVENVVAFIDDAIGEIRATDAVSGPLLVVMLQTMRHELVERPEWSEILESNLRAEVATARRELAEHQVQSDLAAAVFECAVRTVSEQRDRARGIAVRLEQELAEVSRKLRLWEHGERPW